MVQCMVPFMLLATVSLARIPAWYMKKEHRQKQKSAGRFGPSRLGSGLLCRILGRASHALRLFGRDVHGPFCYGHSIVCVVFIEKQQKMVVQKPYKTETLDQLCLLNMVYHQLLL